MNKINKNQIVFFLAFLFITAGFASSDMIKGLGNAAKQFAADVKIYGVTNAFVMATGNVENVTSDLLSYHDGIVDINSLFNRVLGTAVVEKDDMTVVKAKNGFLGNPRPEMSDGDLKWRSENVARLRDIASENGSGFLYVMAPTKGYALDYPSNVEDYTASNCNRFISLLKEKGVPYISLIDSASKDGITDEEMFFATDHHWRPNMGIWASEKVCSVLNDKYGFEYDGELWNMENYNVTTYENWFLGSQGKKVGKYFSPLGADDIDLIVPQFETSLVEEQPAKGHRREGKFADTLLYTENIDARDYYNLNPYATYSGGDFREQIITNNLNPDGKTAVVIRDSYGCAFTPFFSLAFARTYVVDIRDGGYVGEKVNLPEYIKSLKPDYVLVLYTGMSSGDSLYMFE